MKKYCLQKIYLSLMIGFYLFTAGTDCLLAASVSDCNQKGLKFSLEEVSQIGLANNLDIQIAKYDAYIKRTERDNSQSVFDTFLNAQAAYVNDQQKSASSLSGTKSTQNNYSIGLSKTIPTGTTLGVELIDARSSSDSASSLINPNHQANVKFMLNQPLGSNFFGMLDRGQIKLSRLDIDNSDFNVLNRIEGSLSDLQKAYWQLVLCLEDLDIAEQMLERTKSLYKIFEQRKNLGLVEDAELFALEANLIQNKLDIAIAQQQLRIAQNALLLALNEEDFSLNILPENKLECLASEITIEEILPMAIIQRRDYKQAKNELEMKNINLSLKQNSLWPEIDLAGSFARNGLEPTRSDAWQNVSDQDNPELYLGLSVSMPLENRAARSKQQKAENEKAKALLGLKRIEHAIIVQLKNAVDAVNVHVEKIKMQESIIKLQENKLLYEEKRFRNGRSNTDTLVRYQQDLLIAQRNLARTLFGYKVAQIDLQQAENSLLTEYWTGSL